jgi:hypothetical protein
MAELDDTIGPMAFAASFPPEERFAATAGEIAARLAAACGCASDAVDAVREAVCRTFGEAVAGAESGGHVIDVTVRSDGATFEADLACGGQALLHCAKPRSA